MQQINDFFSNISAIKFADVVFAICIIVLFKLLSGSISYGIIKLLKMKVKKGREIKESAFYYPLKVFISILGFYIAIYFLKTPLNLSAKVMGIVNKAFSIISIIIFARGLAKSFVPGSALVYKMIKATEKEEVDTSFNFLLKIIRFVIYVIAIFLIITELGINLNGLIAGFGITGLIVTLAAQDTAKNLFGGVVIFLDKHFVVGDWIQFDKYEGTVEDITFRSTRIRTFENSVVNVPNSVLSNTSINNWSRMEKRRFKCTLCLELDTPLEKVQRLAKRIEEMLIKHDDIIDESVIVKFESISDNGIDLLIYSYTNSVDYASFLEEKQKINFMLMKLLAEEKIELAYDTKTVYVKE